MRHSLPTWCAGFPYMMPAASRSVTFWVDAYNVSIFWAGVGASSMSSQALAEPIWPFFRVEPVRPTETQPRSGEETAWANGTKITAPDFGTSNSHSRPRDEGGKLG